MVFSTTCKLLEDMWLGRKSPQRNDTRPEICCEMFPHPLPPGKEKAKCWKSLLVTETGGLLLCGLYFHAWKCPMKSKNKCSHLNSKHFHMDILSNTSTQFKSNASFSPQIVRLQMCFLSVDDTSTICPSSKHGKLFLSSVLCPTTSLPQVWAMLSSSLHPGIPPFTCPQSELFQIHMGPIPQWFTF